MSTQHPSPSPRLHPTIIYVAGSGRSGSTLLERILHSIPGVTGLGEIHCLWRQNTADIRCACGDTFAADTFWQDVLARAHIGPAQLTELARLEHTVCRTGFLARNGFSPSRLRQSPLVQRFLALHRDLWQAIGAVSGSDVLVDSSKAGPRAWILALDPAVRLVYLHRDPADVLASWRSAKFDPGLGGAMKRMSISAAAVDLWKVDRLLARLARSRTAAYVDYATLCTAPKDTLDELWATLGIPTRGSPDWLSSDTVRPAVPYHSLNGNPDRFGTVPIRISRRSAEWSKISRAERWGIHAAATAVRLTAPRASWRD